MPNALLPAAVAAALLLTAGGTTAETGDVEAGRAIAEENCANCHAIGRDDESRLPIAPPFRGFARNWPLEHLEESLAEGIIVGHDGPMPEFVFEPDEIADLIAYMETIQEP